MFPFLNIVEHIYLYRFKGQRLRSSETEREIFPSLVRSPANHHSWPGEAMRTRGAEVQASEPSCIASHGPQKKLELGLELGLEARRFARGRQ